MLIAFEQDLVLPFAVSLLDHHQLLLLQEERRDLNLLQLLVLPRQLVLELAQVPKLIIGKLVKIGVEQGQDRHRLLAQVELVLQRPL